MPHVDTQPHHTLLSSWSLMLTRLTYHQGKGVLQG
jgi:hypothetical protein